MRGWLGERPSAFEDEIPLPPVPAGFCDTEYVAKRFDELTEELCDFGFDMPDGREEAQEYLTRLMLSATEDDRQELLGCGVRGCKGCCEGHETDAIENQLQLHDEVFRILGPLNAREGTTYDTDACSRYGGCRMFTCVCHETYDPDDDVIDPEPDWFGDYCGSEKCGRKILNRYWAVRRPLPGGGWQGCYCSWDCAIEDLHVDAERGTIGPLTAIMERLEGDMNRIGIYDRRQRDFNEYTSPWKRIGGN